MLTDIINHLRGKTKRFNLDSKQMYRTYPPSANKHFNPSNSAKFKDPSKKSAWNPFLGLVYALISCICIGLLSVIVKKMIFISSGQLSLIRNAGVLFGTLPIAAYCNKTLLGPKEHRWSLLARSLLGATSLYLNMLAYRYLPLTEASIILSTVPALVMIIARVHLHETCSVLQICALITTLVGVLLSIHIPELITNRKTVDFNTTYIIGLVSAIGGTISLAMTFVLIRKLKDVHYSVVLFYLGFVGVLENAILTQLIDFYSLPKCGWDPYLIIAVGLLGFLGHCFTTLAIQTEAAGLASVMKASFDIVISMMLQTVFFSDELDVYNVAGAFTVMISITAIGLRKWLAGLPETSCAKKKLRFLLL